MFIEMLRNEKKTIVLYLLIICVMMGAVFLSITLYIQSNTNMLEKSETELNEINLVNAERTVIANRISGLVSDVLFIADSLPLEYSGNGDISRVEALWVAFSNRKGIYDQIRYLDTDGDEVVRINNGMGYALAAKQSELQNKSSRYYFQDVITLEKNQIYVSRLDLNVENGVLEQPIKPMLRIGTPLFGRNGVLEGVAVLNYAASDMLTHVREIASASHGVVFLLNDSGYWLYNGEDRSKEWAFMYEDRMDESFAAEYPEEWEDIQSNGSGYFTTENGTFSYTSMSPGDELLYTNGVTYVSCRSGPLYIVSYISPESHIGKIIHTSIAGLIPMVIAKYAYVYALIVLFAFFLAVIMVVNKEQNREIKYFSEFDAMTGVYNRRSVYRKLNAIKKDAAKKDCSMTICYIDINGLKETNDKLGHDAGDELIKTVVDVIQENIREKDFIARLGGDEFLIVFDTLDTEGAEKVWDRIVQRFGQINTEENRAYFISVSHGIQTYFCGGNASVDEMINQADTKMYVEKRKIKRNFHAVRDQE